jgi:hypothetical protein
MHFLINVRVSVPYTISFALSTNNRVANAMLRRALMLLYMNVLLLHMLPVISRQLNTLHTDPAFCIIVLNLTRVN